jgi:hypothetical protein
MVTLEISFKRDVNSQSETFRAEYPSKNITPTIFNSGHENELASEIPFIAQEIWKVIDVYAQQHVLTSSVTCVMEFPNGTRIVLSDDIINAKHNTSVLNS